MVTAPLNPPLIAPRLQLIKPKPKTHIIRPTDEENRKWEKFAELGKELHLPVFKFMWRIKNRDGEGNLLHDWEFYSRTWHRNAYNHLVSQMMAKDGDGSSFIGGEISITNTAGTHRTGARAILIGAPQLSGSTTNRTVTVEDAGAGSIGVGGGYRGEAGEDTAGIVVGSGATAEDFDDFALDTKIANGTGAGELSYAESEALVEDFTTLTYTVTHQRFLNNNSGGNVDVNEVGIYVRGHNGGSASSADIWMQVRDVLGATVTVPDTGQLDVSYDIALVFLA